MTIHSTDQIRASMRAATEFLPRRFQTAGQSLLTWLTGCALPGQQPLFSANCWTQFGFALFWLMFGAFLGALLVNTGGFPLLLLPVAWICVVSSARRLQVQIFHAAVHGVFSGNEKVDRLLGEAVSSLLFLAPFDVYLHEHVREHHSSKTFGTSMDPDLMFLIRLGFKPGASQQDLWRHLFFTLVSVRFHGLFLRSRLSATLRARHWLRRCSSFATILVILSIAIYSHLLFAVILSWFLPLTLFFHMSALLQFVSEHRWLLQRLPQEPAKLHVARLTVGRFLGAPYPSQGGWERLRWGFVMLVHSLARVAVMVHGLPEHDWHHRHPASREWTQSIYARRQDIDRGCPNWPAPYAEVWGLGAAIDNCFAVLSQLPPAAAKIKDGRSLSSLAQVM